ncbi:MAG: hypothetical protein LBR82_07280 [Desulfovibrio sp.]|nr:hypothetical protein [Desulfovibrio sp.]
MDFSALRALKDEPAPLYRKHESMPVEQPAFVQLDENGRVLARFDDSDERAVPDAVLCERTLRWGITPFLSGKELAALAENPTFCALLKRAHEGRKIEWDGKNHVGIFTEDAEAASDAIEDFLNSLEPDITVMDVRDWLFDGLSLFDHWSGRPLDTAVQELEEIALEEREADDGGVIIDGDIEQAILREAERIFLEGFHKLDKFHLEALTDAGRITPEQAAAYLVRQKKGHPRHEESEESNY